MLPSCTHCALCKILLDKLWRNFIHIDVTCLSCNSLHPVWMCINLHHHLSYNTLYRVQCVHRGILYVCPEVMIAHQHLTILPFKLSRGAIIKMYLDPNPLVSQCINNFSLFVELHSNLQTQLNFSWKLWVDFKIFASLRFVILSLRWGRSLTQVDSFFNNFWPPPST